MSGNSHTSVRSRQVAAELRTLREQTGMSCAEVAGKLGMSPSKVSRIETGMSGMQPDDVATLLGLYQIPAERRGELLDLVRTSDEKGWWERQPGLPKLWRSLIDFENKATRIQNFEPLVVPGLLQTPDYCRAMIAGTDPTISERELDNLVASRMARQAVLSKYCAPQLLAVVDESALRRQVGDPGVMARQVRALLDATARPHVTVRVVPGTAGPYVGLRGPFMVLEFDADPTVVHVESYQTAFYLEEEPDLASYRLALRNILNAALAPDATQELLMVLLAEQT